MEYNSENLSEAKHKLQKMLKSKNNLSDLTKIKTIALNKNFKHINE